MSLRHILRTQRTFTELLQDLNHRLYSELWKLGPDSMITTSAVRLGSRRRLGRGRPVVTLMVVRFLDTKLQYHWCVIRSQSALAVMNGEFAFQISTRTLDKAYRSPSFSYHLCPLAFSGVVVIFFSPKIPNLASPAPWGLPLFDVAGEAGMSALANSGPLPITYLRCVILFQSILPHARSRGSYIL